MLSYEIRNLLFGLRPKILFPAGTNSRNTVIATFKQSGGSIENESSSNLLLSAIRGDASPSE